MTGRNAETDFFFSFKNTSNNGGNTSKFPLTPPSQRKHSTHSGMGIQLQKDCALIKSKSHESELTNRIGNPGNNINAVTVKDIPISPTTTQASTSCAVIPPSPQACSATTETPKPSLSTGVTGLMSTASSSSYTTSTTSATAMGMRSSVSDMPLNTNTGDNIQSRQKRYELG